MFLLQCKVWENITYKKDTFISKHVITSLFILKQSLLQNVDKEPVDDLNLK